MITYRDNYPMGRKFCSYCKRWRHVCDFSVRQWSDEPKCEVPRTFTSRCTPCSTEFNRRKYGYKPRDWYKHGVPGSETHHKHRLEVNRKSREKRMADEEYRKLVNEYHRIWRNVKKGSVSRGNVTNGSTMIERKPLDDWLATLNIEPTQLADITGISEKTFRVTDRKMMHLEVVDTILTKLGRPDLMVTLYDQE